MDKQVHTIRKASSAELEQSTGTGDHLWSCLSAPLMELSKGLELAAYSAYAAGLRVYLSPQPQTGRGLNYT